MKQSYTALTGEEYGAGGSGKGSEKKVNDKVMTVQRNPVFYLRNK
jgi:hypothetical protein